MSFVSTSTGTAPGLLGAGAVEATLCLHCGSFLDLPRVDPVTRSLARKCLSCIRWQPVDAPREPDRSK